MKLAILTAAFALTIIPAMAQEGELRDKLEALDKEAAAATAEGNEERLQRIHRMRDEIHADSARHQQKDLQAQLEKARAEVEAAKKEGRDEEAGKLSHRVERLERALRDREQGPQREPGKPDQRGRLEHIRQAIRHLKAAGMHEQAEALARQAAGMRRDPEPQRPEPAQPPHGGDGRARALEEMRKAMRQMEEQMAAMKNRLEELTRDRE